MLAVFAAFVMAIGTLPWTAASNLSGSPPMAETIIATVGSDSALSPQLATTANVSDVSTPGTVFPGPLESAGQDTAAGSLYYMNVAPQRPTEMSSALGYLSRAGPNAFENGVDNDVATLDNRLAQDNSALTTRAVTSNGELNTDAALVQSSHPAIFADTTQLHFGLALFAIVSAALAVAFLGLTYMRLGKAGVSFGELDDDTGRARSDAHDYLSYFLRSIIGADKSQDDTNVSTTSATRMKRRWQTGIDPMLA